MSVIKDLQLWLSTFPEGSEIIQIDTSIYEDDAIIYIQTPDGGTHSKWILKAQHVGD